MASSKPLTAGQAAARLSIAVTDLPHGGRWSRDEVMRLAAERPEWLTTARRAHAAHRDVLARQRREAEVERDKKLYGEDVVECLCCGASYPCYLDPGGLCPACNENECPKCRRADEDWLYG